MAAPDGYTVGHIGEQSCELQSNMLIILNPDLRDEVRLTGEGMVEAVFEGQVLEPRPEDGALTNDCFSP